MAKSILFDLDGTLTDSGQGIMNSVVYALEHFGIPSPTETELRSVVGPPLGGTFTRFGVPQDQLDKAIEIYRSRYIPIGRFENEPYFGIFDLLEKLRADGHRLCVATSKPEWMSIEILEHFGLAKYFDIICGEVAETARNSKAAVIAHVLDTCDNRENAVMIGDTVYDITGAKKNNIRAIGVDWGYGLSEDMKQAGADAIAYSMDQLYDLLK